MLANYTQGNLFISIFITIFVMLLGGGIYFAILLISEWIKEKSNR